jgi:calcium-dependent protein kinase
MSPETLQGHPYSTQADLWSIGVCTYMMLAGGQKPFEAMTPKKLVARVLLGNYNFEDKIWAGASDTAKEFIEELLVVNPQNRLSADQALYHPWLADVSSHDGFSAAPDEAFVQRVRESIVNYADQGEFRKLALNVIAKKVSLELALLPLVVVVAHTIFRLICLTYLH